MHRLAYLQALQIRDDYIVRASWSKDQGQGHLPRSGSLEPQSFRQGEWLALVECDAAGTDSVGAEGLGVALSDDTGALGALLSGTSTWTQEGDGLGTAGASAGSSLVAHTETGCGC